MLGGTCRPLHIIAKLPVRVAPINLTIKDLTARAQADRKTPTVSGVVSEAGSTVSGRNSRAVALCESYSKRRALALAFEPEIVETALETVPETVGFLPETVETIEMG